MAHPDADGLGNPGLSHLWRGLVVLLPGRVLREMEEDTVPHGKPRSRSPARHAKGTWERCNKVWALPLGPLRNPSDRILLHGDGLCPVRRMPPNYALLEALGREKEELVRGQVRRALLLRLAQGEPQEL